MKKIIVILATLFFVNLLSAQTSTLYHVDPQGKVLKGSLNSLISYIQEGNPIRVGWKLDLDQDGKADLEHWVDAEFISILGGQVFTQIETIYAQSPRLDISQIQIGKENMKWTAVIGTNGKLLSRFVMEDMGEIDENRKALFEELSKVNTQEVETMWAKGK